MNRGAVLLLVICIAGIVGYFSVTGSFLKTTEEITEDKLMKSATVWLNTDEGKDKNNFPSGGIVDRPIPVYIGNTTEILYWYIPVKNNEGLYPGLIMTDREEFRMPNGIIKFAEPRSFIFLLSNDNLPLSREDAHSWFIQQHPEYSAGQMTKPRAVASKNKLFWMSEVIENGEIIDELYIRIRTY